MRNRGKICLWGAELRCFCAFVIVVIPFVISISLADLGPENVLILVNGDSPTSRCVARMYRQYYPAIEDVQILELSGLPDCGGPGSTSDNEIITREQYNACIAGPVRAHLLEYALTQQIMVIVTTAGIPYRIEDTTYTDVIYPAGSNYNTVLNNCQNVDAASVESELTCLWFTDYGNCPTGGDNRIVNPYQGYRQSSITLFDRELPCTKSIVWNRPINYTETPPKMEGQMKYSWPYSYGTINRNFHAGDIYLTCRLDGPKSQGQSAVFAVREMLERSKRASTAFYGVNPLRAVIAIDDCPGKTFDLNRIYNLDGSVNYNVYNPGVGQPPDAPTVLSMDDYSDAFDVLTSGSPVNSTGVSTGQFSAAYNLKVLLDQRTAERTCQECLNPSEAIVFFCCYGRNGDEGSGSDYLMQWTEDSEHLFRCLNGAVFTSIESFNALTMFSDVQTVPTAQGKIVDFITIGGTGAIGHAFEPLSSAAIDNIYLTYNLFADRNGDRIADMTFVEAAFTAIPYLSWAEVVIGDPLMRMSYNEQADESTAWKRNDGDINCDGYIDLSDYRVIRRVNASQSRQVQGPFADDSYNDLCDINYDGYIDLSDIRRFRSILYSQ